MQTGKAMAIYDFNQVYEECKAKVWSLISKYVYSREDREDLFQEVFFTIHKALPRFRGDSAISTWVYTIAVNTAINHIRKQKRYRWVKELLQNLRIIEEETQAPVDDLHNLKLLEKLNPQQRMILLLAEVEEKKLDEIAVLIGIPVGTVKSNLHRAKEIIKKEVRKNGKQ